MENLVANIKQGLYNRFRERCGSCPQVEHWTRTSFAALSEDISKYLVEHLGVEKRQLLGVTVSLTTLKRIFIYGYELGEVIDPRKKKTLDLICIYLGYEGVEDYKENLPPSVIPEENAFQLIEEALRAEFMAYQKIPIIFLDDIRQYFHEDGPAFSKIRYNLVFIDKKGNSIAQPLNPSTYELINCELMKTDERGIWIQTKEYWYLKWHDKQTGEHRQTYNSVNEQIYLITQKNNDWKIWSNMYDTENDFKIK